MRTILVCLMLFCIALSCTTKGREAEYQISEVADDATARKHLVMDVHNLEPGKVTFEAVVDAHQKDLAVQSKYGVKLIKFWVDETAGKVYCLAESRDSVSLFNTHRDAHGLLPDRVFDVSEGVEATMSDNPTLFLDVHKLGPGNVTEDDVAAIHIKDLDVQSKHGVEFINYWVDTRAGIVMCLVEARDSVSIANAHKEAHGFIPDEIHRVKQGQ
ncbi:MAG: DUF4242 domain-containing protein [Chryseolinea sp.]